MKYTTILRWTHAKGYYGYAVAQSALRALEDNPALDELMASNLLEELGEALHVSPKQLVVDVQHWAEHVVGLSKLDSLPIPVVLGSGAFGPSSGPPGWTPSAIKLARMLVAASAQITAAMSHGGAVVGAWCDRKAERAARSVVNRAAQADGSKAPSVPTRKEFMALIFGGEQKVPVWVRQE